MKRRQPSVRNGHAALVIDPDVGMLMTAGGVRDRRQHQPDRGTIQTGQVPRQINRLTASEGGDDPQHPLLTAREGADRVVGDPGRVQPPHPGLITRPNPRMARCGEPATSEADQQLHRGLQWIHALRPGPQPGMIHTHHESLSLVGFGSAAIARPVPLRVRSEL